MRRASGKKEKERGKGEDDLALETTTTWFIFSLFYFF
jgi:hypothetical protein